MTNLFVIKKIKEEGSLHHEKKTDTTNEDDGLSSMPPTEDIPLEELLGPRLRLLVLIRIKMDLKGVRILHLQMLKNLCHQLSSS